MRRTETSASFEVRVRFDNLISSGARTVLCGRDLLNDGSRYQTMCAKRPCTPVGGDVDFEIMSHENSLTTCLDYFGISGLFQFG